MAGSDATVAVIDDDPAFNELVLDILASEGLAGVAVPGGDDVVDRLAALRPAVTVMDWRLDANHGPRTANTALERMAADPDLARMPIILCSGDMPSVREASPRLASILDVVAIEKPFSVDAFVGVMERALARAGHPLESGFSATTDRPEPSAEVRALLGALDPHTDAAALLRYARAIFAWPAADLWLADGNLLRCVAADADAERQTFADASVAMPMLPGFSLCGRVYVTGRPAWIPDVTADRNYPRLELVRRSGLSSAAGVPLLLERGPQEGAGPAHVVGVLAVYGATPAERDDDLLSRLWSAGMGAAEWADQHREVLLRPRAVRDAMALVVERGLELADLVVVDACAPSGDLYRLAAVHRDPARAQLARLLSTYQPSPTGPIGVAATSGKRQVAEANEADLRRWTGTPERLTLFRALEMSSICAVPARGDDGRVVGVLTGVSAAPGAFDGARIAQLEQLAAELGPILARHL
ncbi:MAG TPA: GAF domain-containing protein [Candidatus Limnocylindria bacterium]|nr:GAF domain-containing protein [Candidatus Limnocylindria bacterium]